MRVRVMAGVVLLTMCCGAQGQEKGPWKPSRGIEQVPLWPEGKVPDARAAKGPEEVSSTGMRDLVAGKPWTAVSHVARPTLSFYPAKGKNTGATVMVFPGGGYEILAIDLEGTEVCDWFTQRGVNCVVLKYRVPAPRSEPYWGAYPQSAMALEDAQRAIRLLRARAAHWKIDPHKLGVLGFSAGGHLVAAVSVHWKEPIYRPMDAADKESCRPDFGVVLYPGHLSLERNSIALTKDIRDRIASDDPPTFLLQNEDDNVDRVEDSLSYYMGLKKAGVPVEMHLYAKGGHAFGLRRTKNAATRWPELVYVWMGSLGLVPAE
ncbi:MAG: alpha/beta hydrolase [Acidobacteria bacterium]|nr:alpha/beta hydrolase [Acidobacteriota bacterium]